jgi:molybdenum cofactor guanylyltransferase
MPEPDQMTRCTGAILIGGRSSRMGTPKHLMTVTDGRTMLDHVRSALQPICSRVVVVDAFGNDCGEREDVVRDRRPDTGPLGGIEALLASGIDSQYLVCPCDLPLVTPDLLRMLLAPSAVLASVFQVEGRAEIEPLPARIRAEVLPIVRRLLNRQQRSVWRLMREVQSQVVKITAAQAWWLTNVNTPEEFRETAASIANRQSGAAS